MRELTIEEVLGLGWPELQDIVDELNDPRFSGRTHGIQGTWGLGCNGPMCKKANKNRSRRINERRARMAGREYKPYGRQYDRDDLLDAAIQYGKLQLALRRAGAA